MLLVIIAALAIAWVVERRNHERDLERLRASAEAELAESRRLLSKFEIALKASRQALERLEANLGDASPRRTKAEAGR
jgi:hypothetical protein